MIMFSFFVLSCPYIGSNFCRMHLAFVGNVLLLCVCISLILTRLCECYVSTHETQHKVLSGGQKKQLFVCFQLLFSSMLTVNILKNKNEVDSTEWNFLLTGGRCIQAGFSCISMRSNCLS